MTQETVPSATRLLFLLKRALLVVAVLCLLAALFVSVAFVVAWHRYNGVALARRISNGWNRSHRGRLMIGKIEWTPSAVLDLLTGRYHRLVITNLAIYDSEGRLAVYVPRAVGRARLWPLIRHGDFFLEEIEAPEALLVLRRYRRPDGPDRDGDEWELGLVGAFGRPKWLWRKRRKKGHRFELDMKHVRIGRLQFEMDFPGLKAKLRDAHLEGWIAAKEGTEKIRTKVFFRASATSPGGVIQLAGRKIPVQDLDIFYAQSPRASPGELDFHFRALLAGSLVEVRADLPGLYYGPRSVNGWARITDGGPLLARLTSGLLSGPKAHLYATALGPVTNPTGFLVASGIEGRKGRLSFSDLAARLRISQRRLLAEEVSASVLGGRASLTGTLDLERLTWKAEGRLSRLHLDRAMEAPKAKWASRLMAAFRAKGDIRKRNADIRIGHLALSFRQAIAKVFHGLTARAHLLVEGPQVIIRNLRLASAGLALQAEGRLSLARRRLSLSVRGETGKLSRLLAKWGLPAWAEALRLEGRISGPFLAPGAKGRIEVARVGHRRPRQGKVVAAWSLQRGVLSLDRIRAWLYGGWASGTLRATLFAGRLDRPVRHPRIEARLRIQDVALERMFGRSVTGRLRGELRAKGPLGALSGALSLRVPRITVGKNRLRNGVLEASFRRGDLFLDYAALSAEPRGRIRAWGSMRAGGALDLTAQVETFALSSIPGLGRLAPRLVAGRLDGHLSLTGTRSWPVLDGVVRLLAARLRGIPVVDASVRIVPSASGSDVSGHLARGLQVSGRLVLKPEPKATLALSFRRYPLHRVLPELRSRARAKVFLTGRAELALDPEGLAGARVELSSVSVEVQAPSPDPLAEPRLLVFRNEGPVRLTLDGRRLTVDSLAFSGEGSSVRVDGWVSGKTIALRASGRLGLAALLPFLPPRLQVASIEGSVGLRASLTGSPRSPKISGALTLRDAAVLLVNRPEPFALPSGRITLLGSPQGGYRFRVTGVRVGIGAEALVLNGRISVPASGAPGYDLRAKGRLPAAILALVAPEEVSSAEGQVAVDLRLTGTSREPNMSGHVELSGIRLSLRGVRRRLEIQQARLAFQQHRITIQNFQGLVDDGTVSAKGYIVYEQGSLADVEVRIYAQTLPMRQPRVYELELNANVRLSAEPEGLTLTGRVDLLDARYIQKFDVVRAAFLRKRVYETSKPFWERSRLLRNLRLNLAVTTSGNTYIQNNIADIRLDGNIFLGGTLASPKLSGQIQAEEGTFRIPFMRGVYELRTGEIDFNRGDEPYLTLVGEASVRDSADQEHLVTLTLEGFLSKIRIDLSSDTNLPKSQILVLLAAGKTTDTMRHQLRGSSDAGPGSHGATGNPLDTYDPVIKQVSGDFLSDLVAAPIKNVTKLDLFRLELGTETFQVRVEKRLGHYFRLRGESEFGLMGQQRQEGALEGKLHDDVYVDVKGRRLIPGEDVFEEEDPLQGRVQVRYRIRFRGGLLRSLGF